jgi:hypothetical protein
MTLCSSINCYSLFVLPLTQVLLRITACHFIPTFQCLQTCMPCGRVQEDDFTPVSIPELVHWAGVPLRNGALDGKPATLFHRWKEHDPRYDPINAENIKLSRWRQIKRYFKLSMGIEEKKRGEAGYDPCVKYDYLSLPCT